MPETQLPLTGEKVLVTGVSRSAGIGAAIDKWLSQAEATVAAHGYSDYDLKMYYNDALTGLTGLVLNHAYSTHCPIGEWTGEHTNKHLAVNVRASMLMIQHFAAHAQAGGCITLFTSGQYLGPMVSEIAYAVSKEAIRCLCVQAAAALARQGIRVNCVNPGPNDTGYLSGEEYEAVKAKFPMGVGECRTTRQSWCNSCTAIRLTGKPLPAKVVLTGSFLDENVSENAIC